MNNTHICNPETHPLTWRINSNNKNPIWLREYQEKNGYHAMHKAVTCMSSEDIIELINNAQLKGRGGGGFLTGIKWSMMFNSKNSCFGGYLICNADEMEPGTYKDRFLMERLPHLLIEGIMIACYALKVTCAYIFLRYEYFIAYKNLKRAISEIESIGWIGKYLFNSEFKFNVFLHTGAGRYICGEETALINALEGRRAIPRAKPPFPSSVGLWGQPTCINNVETLCNIPSIIEYGATWYKNISLKISKDSGTKLMGFSGRVNNPGIWEFPFGVSAGDILENYAHGMQSGLFLKAWQPGGASTEFLTKKSLDVPMDFDHIMSCGSRFGTGMAIAIDQTVSMVALVRNLEEFFSRESCGWCTPCRDGLPWIVKILISLEKKHGDIGDIELLERLSNILGPGKTFCAHAPGAMGPLKSALKYFKNEFELGISLNQFKQKDMISYIQI